MQIEYKIAGLDDLDALISVGDKLFDNPIKVDSAKEFLNDSRHHMLLAYDREDIVGMISAVNYIHPDKDPNLFINEASVIESYQNQGIGRELVKRMVAHGKTQLNCNEAWVLTMQSNKQAQKSYRMAGGDQEPESVVMFEFS